MRIAPAVAGALLGTFAFAIAAAAPLPAPRPPDGTYTYTLKQASQVLGTSTVVLSGGAGTVVVEESARYPGIAARSRSTFDATDLAERSYTITADSSGGPKTASVSFSNGSATLKGGGKSVPLQSLSGARRLLYFDKLASALVLAPAIANVEKSGKLTLLVGPQAIEMSFGPSDAPRPSGVPATDRGLAATLDGVSLTFWYDPKTFVLHDLEQPGSSLVLSAYTPAKSVLPAPVLATPLPLPSPQYSAREVTFTSSDGVRLAGTLTIPRGAGPFPAVVLVHGSGAHDRDETIGPNKIFLQIANALSNGGYAVLRYDKRGVGASGGTATDDREPLVADARAALSFLLQQHDVDPKRVFMLGHSEGAMIAPLISDDDRRLRGIILMGAPALPLEQIVMQQTVGGLTGQAYAKAHAAEAKYLAEIDAGSNAHPEGTFLRSWHGVDPAAVIARVHAAVLILQGGKDFQVLPKDLPRLVNAARKAHRDVTVKTFADDTHLMIPVTAKRAATLADYFEPAYVDPAVTAAMLAWLKTH